MANIMSRQQWRLQQRWFSEEQARIIAYKQQKNRWMLVWNSFKLNEIGQQYSLLWPKDRAIIRRATETGRPTYHYTWDNNRVVLKNEYRKRK